MSDQIQWAQGSTAIDYADMFYQFIDYILTFRNSSIMMLISFKIYVNFVDSKVILTLPQNETVSVSSHVLLLPF